MRATAAASTAVQLNDAMLAPENDIKKKQTSLAKRKAKLNTLDENVQLAQEEYDRAVGSALAEIFAGKGYRKLQSNVKALEMHALIYIRKKNLLKDKIERIRHYIDKLRKVILALKDAYRDIERSARSEAMKMQALEEEREALCHKEKIFDDRTKLLLKKRSIERSKFREVCTELQLECIEHEKAHSNIQKQLNKQCADLNLGYAGSEEPLKSEPAVTKSTDEMLKKVFSTALSNLELRKTVRKYKGSRVELQKASDNIEAATCVRSLDELNRTFSALEQKKSTLLMCLNALNAEISSAKIKQAALSAELEKKKKEFQEKLAREQEKAATLSEQMQRISEISQANEANCSHLKQKGSNLKTFVMQALFKLLVEAGSPELLEKHQKLESNIDNSDQFLFTLQTILSELLNLLVASLQDKTQHSGEPLLSSSGKEEQLDFDVSDSGLQPVTQILTKISLEALSSQTSNIPAPKSLKSDEFSRFSENEFI